MVIRAYPAAPFYENAYLIACEKTGAALVVDPGDGTPRLIESARAAGVDVTAILLTHAHLDHISGVDLARQAFGVPVYLHPADQFLYDGIVEQGRIFDIDVRRQSPPDAALSPASQFVAGNLSVGVREVPGHSPGSVAFEVKDASGAVTLVVGDTLFAGSIGRTDLPGGDLATLLDAITRVLLVYPDDVLVYPGHGDPTTVGRERRSNPYLR